MAADLLVGGRTTRMVAVARARRLFRLFANGALHKRRGGALVRFVTPVASGDLDRADATLKSFIAEAAPLVPAYVP
jgi:hypothetical protein